MSLFKFEPLTDAQAKELKYGLWAEGIYQFTILEAYETTSKSGNPMIKILLELMDGNKRRKLTDYLLLDPNSKMRYKLKHLCEAVGIGDKYAAGAVDTEEFLGKSGQAQLGVQESKDPQYSDQNVISDYVKFASISSLTDGAKVIKNEIVDDQIPF